MATDEQDVNLKPHWKVAHLDGRHGIKMYYERKDGAYVWYDINTPHVNPCLPGFRPWTAFTADDRYLTYHRRRRGRPSPIGVPRRWKNPEAAMDALDQEHPLPEKL